MTVTQRAIFQGLAICLSLLMSCQVMAQCKQKDECGDHIYYGGKPFHPGCEQLDVTIHNTTQFEFVVDDGFDAPSKTGDTSNFGAVPAGEVKTFSIVGVALDGSGNADNAHNDEVDTAVRYIAKRLNNDTQAYDLNAGTDFTISLKKASCNSGTPVIQEDDHQCYTACKICTVYGCHWDCNLGGAAVKTACNICTGSNAGDDGVCKSNYKYESIDCKTATIEDPPADSSVSSSPGLFTRGANLDANDGSNSGEDSSVPYSTYSRFRCGQPSECGTNDDCNGGTEDDNKPAKLEFYVKPSPVETLTITFPFNSKTPMAKLMKDSVYNNLNAKYVGLLGSYFSFSSVAVGENTLAFSTLCNAESCP